MGTQLAEVQTLTAEVRVLMVGNRQVTLSVFRQLDTVHPKDIEPFGRVRDPSAHQDWIGVVGRDPHGNLVRSGVGLYAYYAEPNLDVAPAGLWERRSCDPMSKSQWRCPSPLREAWSHLPLIVLAGLR